VIELSEFEADAEEFLSSVATPRKPVDSGWGEGDDRVELWPDRDPEEDAELVRAAREWKAREFDAGFGWITGPTELGGRGLPEPYRRAYEARKRRYDTPDESPLHVGLGMIAPTLERHGSPEVRRTHLPRLWRGDDIACQLFSEPDAGSDLAGVRSLARRDGDHWVLDGQKVWTSGAHFSDIGEVLCVTDRDAPRHHNLTAFLVDMHAPGVEVRPLRQMTGGASFNEVFLSGVRVPDDHRLGEPGEGWQVALTTLMNERSSISAGRAGGGTGTVHRLFELARHSGAADDPLVRQALADVHIRLSAARWTAQRGLAKIKAGGTPGPEMSIGKATLTRNQALIVEAVSMILGPKLCADTGEWGTFGWSPFVLGVPGVRIAGGTDEVIRNILAERVLGLPREG
jgi:alkylation response protein AidB-like acyl-CoA dehydrogenase